MSKKVKTYLKANGHGCNAIELSIGYELGGYNYFSGASNRRGYYAYAVPLTVSERDGYRSFTQALFDGAKVFLKEATRFSQKTADSFALTDAVVQDLLDKVLQAYGMTLEKDEKGELITL